MRKPDVFTSRGQLPAVMLSALLGVALLVGLAGCGAADNGSTATSSFNAKARKAQHKPVVVPGQPDITNMVAAASVTKVGPPIELKFNLEQSPMVGQPLDVSVALVPRSPALESVSVAFSGSDGLDVVEGDTMPAAAKPADGAPLLHTVKVLPKTDGIFSVTAVVSVVSANQSSSRTFSIPVIAGSGLPALTTKPEVAKGT